MSGWIGVDLDGTLAKHYWPQDGPYDELKIGKPVPLMVLKVKEWLAEGTEVRIFTARWHGGPDVIAAIQAWCEEHIGTCLQVTATKDYRMVELWDDRAVRVIQDTGARCCWR